MPKFKVIVDLSVEFEVEARDEHEAEFLAETEYDEWLDDASVDVYVVEEIKTRHVHEIGAYPIEEIGILAAKKIFKNSDYPFGLYVADMENCWVGIIHTPSRLLMKMPPTKEEAIEWIYLNHKGEKSQESA